MWFSHSELSLVVVSLGCPAKERVTHITVLDSAVYHITTGMLYIYIAPEHVTQSSSHVSPKEVWLYNAVPFSWTPRTKSEKDPRSDIAPDGSTHYFSLVFLISRDRRVCDFPLSVLFPSSHTFLISAVYQTFPLSFLLICATCCLQ